MPRMAGNSRRVGFRADAADLELIQRAASVVNEPTSEFVRKAALARAEDVLRRGLVTAMESEQFDALMSALDAADDAPRLAAAARRPEVFTRR